MSQFYRNLHPAGKLGLWGLPVLLLAIALMIVELREPEVPDASRFPGLVALDHSANTYRVHLGPSDANLPLHASYRPISTATSARVLQRLLELRVLYKQLSLNIRIHADENNPGLQQVAEQLNDMLVRYELGSVGIEKAVASGLDTPMVLYCTSHEVSIAFGFLSAISPYIHAPATVVVVPQLPAGQMQLHLLAIPQFAEDGTVVLE